MRKIITILVCLFTFNGNARAQEKDGDKEPKGITVPLSVKTAFSQKYPAATKVTWEKEKNNYEANWGGKSGEDNSVQFTPSGTFIEALQVIPVSLLPTALIIYVRQHYNGAKITEAGRVTNANGKITYEAEVKKKDIVFDEKGNFIKVED